MKVNTTGLFLACALLAGEFTLFRGGSWFHVPPPPPVPHVAPRVKIALRLRPAALAAAIHAAAARHKLPPAFIKSIVAAESNFDCGAISPKGAIGLMQLMPATAAQYGANPAIPEQNIDAGAHYLRVLLDRYRNKKNGLSRAIAAYNAGPGNVDRYNGIPALPRDAMLRHPRARLHAPVSEGIPYRSVGRPSA
jgi:soluble lytic murein transglycosylase-like protein